MHRRLLSAAATSALLLGLAACGEPTDGPVTTPPPSISVSGPSDGGGDTEPSDGGGETVEPTAEAPSIPPPDPADFAGMDEHTAEGAEQAFRYYIAMSMWAHQTGNTEKLTTLQTSNCGGCDDLNRDVPALKEHGEYWGEFSIHDVGTTLHESSKYEHEIGYFFSITPHTRPNEEFTGRVEAPAIEYITVGGMDWLEDRWIVGGIDAEWGVDKHV